MRINQKAAICLSALFLAPTSVAAQSDDAPLSAIDWLSDVVRNAPLAEIAPRAQDEDVASSATATTITTMPLGQVKLDAVGILPRSTTGLPADFWARSSATELAREIRDIRTDLPPPLAQFLMTLLLAELPAPADSTGGAELFLARVDKFLEIGALDRAEALLARAGPTRPEVFGRWFDVSLLTGAEDQACRSMLQNPSIAPTYPARIFCLARSGDWDAAALTLGTGKTVNLISEKEDALLARFLDPDLFEGEPLLPVPDRITPLNFRMHDAIGEPLSLGGLPNAFSYATLTDRSGWKARIGAAERLARASAIPPSKLFALYSERSPAASGGVWDRVEAVQEFEAALAKGDISDLSFHVPQTMRALRSAGLEHVFGQAFGAELGRLDLRADVMRDALRAALMSKDYEQIAREVPEDAIPPLWRAVATGTVEGSESEDALEEAIIAGLNMDAPAEQFAPLLDERRLGEAALQAMALLADGPRTDPADIERGLGLLSQLGLDDVARQTALHMLLTRPRA